MSESENREDVGATKSYTSRLIVVELEMCEFRGFQNWKLFDWLWTGVGLDAFDDVVDDRDDCELNVRITVLPTWALHVVAIVVTQRFDFFAGRLG